MIDKNCTRWHAPEDFGLQGRWKIATEKSDPSGWQHLGPITLIAKAAQDREETLLAKVAELEAANDLLRATVKVHTSAPNYCRKVVVQDDARALLEEIATCFRTRQTDNFLHRLDAYLACTAQEGPDYKAAWREYDEALGWLQEHRAVPPRYLGWHIGAVASDLIQCAYPGLRTVQEGGAG